MLSPQEICEQLSVDEFIELVQIADTRKFDVLSIQRTDTLTPVIFINREGLRERIALVA